ncbi:BioY protein [Brachybacterium sp. P6-10-X1]|uniref:biotin transporter BioY n=1 Tax=Brachybacterium sp. P6-10-X1 TaxID=1903186 RepID=UPI000971BB0D|nr:biotin transporter BioY [Brachybacterium sp. P6-10-X1]APX34186.1 BioY protein [Brachybacterium sp. P6-10-X1]
MSAIAVPARRPVLADALAPHRSRVQDAALVLTGTAVVALLAQVTIPLPLVPITGQTLGVILVGAALGSRRGAAALATYLLVGLAGAPVFAEFTGGPAAVLTPSFGFVLGFIPAAFVAGWFAERAWDRRPVLAMVGFVAASAVPFLVGVPYLGLIASAVLGADLGIGGVLAAGLWPFIPGGLVKAAIAAVLIPAAWRGVRRLDERG